MASVHLSISKHLQLSSLSTGGEVIAFFPALFSSASPCSQPLLITLHPNPPVPFRSIPFYRSIYPPPSSTFYKLPSPRSQFFSSIPTPFFILQSLLHPTSSLLCLPSPSPLTPISQTLNGTAHSATKQSCLQHRTLANQPGPEFSSPQIHSTTL